MRAAGIFLLDLHPQAEVFGPSAELHTRPLPHTQLTYRLYYMRLLLLLQVGGAAAHAALPLGRRRRGAAAARHVVAGAGPQGGCRWCMVQCPQLIFTEEALHSRV